MSKLKVIGVLALVATLLLLYPAIALAQPPLPSTFYGTASDADGNLVPEGTTVTAYVDDVMAGSDTTDADGNYVIDVLGDDQGTTEVEGGTAGDTVTFTIGGDSAGQTGTFMSGTPQMLNLSVGELPPTGDEALMPVMMTVALGGVFLTLIGVRSYRRARA
jgi:hypothetical protein